MYKLQKDVYLCSPKRTAIGSFSGTLAHTPASQLGATVLKSVVQESGVEVGNIDQVMLGCVLQAGVGQAPARQALIYAGLSEATQAMTVNKVCSSGLYAVMLAANAVELGQANSVLAGGMENMSLAPYYLRKMRSGSRLGHAQAEDAIITDALWDVYNDKHMGNCAELCARENSLTREMQDEFCLKSYERANKAIQEGVFQDEITPVTVRAGKKELEFSTDEEPGNLKAEKVPSLRPVFEKDGTVTAANASSINDGAAAMLVCSAQFAKDNNLTPLARVVAQGWNAQAPEWFTTAPVGAVENVLKAAGKDVSEIDLFEINEAFSAVSLACQAKLNIPEEKLNVHGGAVALGHPVGASGARILVTLLHALKRHGKKSGVASLCNGGGEATALMVELL